MKVQQNRPLHELNWWKVGGQAEFFVAPKTEAEVIEALKWASEKNLELHIFSGGSNILVQDGLLHGLVLSLHDLSGIIGIAETPEKIAIEAWAGTPKSELAKIFLQKKLAPAAFLTGIPGDIGGGVVMNAGVGEDRRPREFCEIVEWIDVLDLTPGKNLGLKRRVLGSELHWEYRHCSGYQPGLVTKVGVAWENKPSPELMNEVREATKKRVASQPLTQPSCGSVFRNPPGHKSARLIEGAGLKGFTIGGAQVSTKHANFIVNIGGATATDVHAVIAHVRETVKKTDGVELQTEVKYIGRWN